MHVFSCKIVTLINGNINSSAIYHIDCEASKNGDVLVKKRFNFCPTYFSFTVRENNLYILYYSLTDVEHDITIIISK